MKLTDKIMFAVSLRLTPGNFLFIGACIALAAALPYAARLLG